MTFYERISLLEKQLLNLEAELAKLEVITQDDERRMQEISVEIDQVILKLDEMMEERRLPKTYRLEQEL